MRLYVVNVGVNTADAGERGLRSPVFPDGTFEFVPIKEESRFSQAEGIRSYSDLPSWTGQVRSLADFLPERVRQYRAHADPEFETFTYGDECDDHARAVGLRGMQPGDVLLFLAGLERWAGDERTGQYGFFLIGGLRIDWVLPRVTQEPAGREGERSARNAHVVRGRCTGSWDGFWVFGGSDESRRFERAVPVTRDICERVFRTASGNPWEWAPDRSDLQTIGSYTRTCRCVLDTGNPEQQPRAGALREWIATWDPEGAAVIPGS